MRPLAGANRSPLFAVVPIVIVLLTGGCGSERDSAVEGSTAQTVDSDGADDSDSADGADGSDSADDSDSADGSDDVGEAGEGHDGEDVMGTAPADGAEGAGTDPGDDPEQATGELFPDVIEARAEQGFDGLWTFSATLSSPYDTPQRYADAWRVVGPDGEVYGIRELAHDHANEQPFTRSQSGIEIPDDVSVVTIEGRDQLSGCLLYTYPSPRDLLSHLV